MNGFCAASRSGCDVDCSKLQIAKTAIFNILDWDTPKGTINSQDSASLGVRIGLMTFSDNDTALDYSSGNIKLQQKISDFGSTDAGTPYQTTFCGAGAKSSCTMSSSGGSTTVKGQTYGGGTPLANALREAKLYLDAHKVADTKANECRQKFVILISDGADTYACSGNGQECQDHMYKRRRQVVAAAKQLNDAGYRVFVIGFGSMPAYQLNTLNWMAYYGGTDNSSEPNSGSTTGYPITLGCNPDGTAEEKALCCNLTAVTGKCFPEGITSCTNDTSGTSADPAYCTRTTFRAASGTDPGYESLSGYAFLADNTDNLTDALRAAFEAITGQTYSFTSASVQTIRVRDEKYLYEASFTPKTIPTNDSFWPGDLIRYSLDNDGNVTTADWSAADKLEATAAVDRNIFTLKSGTITEFTNANFNLPSYFGITSGTSAQREAARQLVIDYIRGGELSGSQVGKKLGDIFHSDPITVGTPSQYFYDRIDKQTTTGFETFRDAHERTSANGKRLIIAGANDGQFHVFKAADEPEGGKEVWSFIPPNFLTRLIDVAHRTHPTSCVHRYFVDGSPTVADVWWGADKTAKASTDWHTLLVVSEGRGGYTKLWSSSANCDTELSDEYNSGSSPHYCGYYAFDITDTTQTSPTYLWKLGGSGALTAARGNHLGEPWGKMAMGRVLYDSGGSKEKWVGFIGGGLDTKDTTGNVSATSRGKGFYVVDSENGNILWTTTRNGPSGTNDKVHTSMDYALVGQAAMLDYDNDGFIDTVYIADKGGNVWRFKFCLKSEETCTQADWSGDLLFNATGNVRPIFTKPAVSRDTLGNVWVYFGTGDAINPTSDNAQESIYAVIDTSRAGTYTKSNLKGIDSDSADTSKHFDVNNPGGYHGWYKDFLVNGIKVLGDPIVAFDILYFTTYTPGKDLCDQQGLNHLYALGYTSGAGQFEDDGEGNKSCISLDSGPPSTVQLSIDDETGRADLFVGKKRYDLAKPQTGGRSNLLYWRDNRVGGKPEP